MFSVCPRCGDLVVPEREPDYFSFFGLKPSYFIDQDRLQNRFYEYSRVLHPDRFHGKAPASLVTATRWFAFLNQALRVLKSDSERAEYLFQLAHFKPQNVKTSLPPDLAEEYFTLQENLEDSDWSEEQKRDELGKFRGLIDNQAREAEKRQAQAFREWENAGSLLTPAAAPFFERAAKELNQKNYLKSMSLDLEKKCRK